MALYRLHDPETFGTKLESSPRENPPSAACWPRSDAPFPRATQVRIVHRVAGLGAWGANGSRAAACAVARRAGSEGTRPSALPGAERRRREGGMVRRGVWALSVRGEDPLRHDPAARRRCPDPCVRWMAPARAAARAVLLARKVETSCRAARGSTTVVFHGLGTAKRSIGAPAPLHPADLKRREHWLYDRSRRLADAIDDDWRHGGATP